MCKMKGDNSHGELNKVKKLCIQPKANQIWQILHFLSNLTAKRNVTFYRKKERKANIHSYSLGNRSDDIRARAKHTIYHLQIKNLNLSSITTTYFWAWIHEWNWNYWFENNWIWKFWAWLILVAKNTTTHQMKYKQNYNTWEWSMFNKI